MFRCFTGERSGPASWPDASRLVEAIIIELCAIFPKNVRKTQSAAGQTRWSLVLENYLKIKRLVLQSQFVMENTELQLVNLNQKTIGEW